MTLCSYGDNLKTTRADSTSERMRDAEREVRNVGHGEVVIRVDKGRIVQIDTVKRQRYERGG